MKPLNLPVLLPGKSNIHPKMSLIKKGPALKRNDLSVSRKNQESKNKNAVIILAAGSGLRFNGSNFPKQFIKLAGKTILEHTIGKFEQVELVDEIYLIVPQKFVSYTKKIVESNNFKKNIKVVIGGKTRQESSWLGILNCGINTSKVLIHDAVRPFIDKQTIINIIKALDQYPSVDLAIPLADTLIEVSPNKFIKKIPKREKYRRGQTPQGFRFEIIKTAHKMAQKDKLKNFTDDCGLIVHYNLADVYVIDGKQENIKITYPIDVNITEIILANEKK
jgi:ribitol-5-phosphate 2-dehydrogenase (NADP+) / D-ribitol-5-phosphate cytidylyltransferase